MVGAYYVKGDGFRRENGGVAQLAHDQRPDAERVAARDHALGRGHDQRIGTLDLLERIDELVEQSPIGRSRDQMVSDVDWKIEPRRISSRRSFIALEILPLCAMAKPPELSSA